MLVGNEAAEDLIGGPRDGGDGRDPEPLVDHRAARVVDTGDDALHAERLAGDAGRHDVGVVAAGDRGDGVGFLDARLDEDVAVEAETDDRRAAEALGEPPERLGPLVDDRDRMAVLLQQARELAAHAPAPHDDDVHRSPIGPLRRRCYRSGVASEDATVPRMPLRDAVPARFLVY